MLVKVSIVRPAELGPGELQAWRKMLEPASGLDSPFLAPEYVQALDRTRDGVRVAVFEADGDVAGFLPYERGARGVGGPSGGGISDVTGLARRPGFRWDPRAFLHAAGLRAWKFTNLLDEQIPGQARYVVRADSPVVDFPGGYEEFVEGRRRASKQMVQSLMRKRRKMERELGELRFVLHSTRGEDLARLMEWKTGQYRAMGEWDRFGDPRITALLRDLQYAVGEQCTGTLSVLTAGGRPAAAHFGVRSRTTLSWWFPAYDPDLGRYSPGMQLLFLMVEAAADQGVQRINLGIGAHDYKDAVRTGAVVVGRGLVDDGSTTAVLHRLRRAPRHHLRPLVVGNPRLHALARRLMRPRGVSRPR